MQIRVVAPELVYALTPAATAPAADRSIPVVWAFEACSEVRLSSGLNCSVEFSYYTNQLNPLQSAQYSGIWKGP